MRQESKDETRNVRQQLELWMRRLEEMARDDSFNCQVAQRDIKALKDKVDYVERLILHQGHSRGSQYRRSTTPRPPTVPNRSDREQPSAVNRQLPADVSDERKEQHTGYNQGYRSDSHVDKWLPATRERYTTQMAANKNRERHITQQKQESQRKADEIVRGLVESKRKPWKPRRDRKPTHGLTGLLDPRVIDQAEVDPSPKPNAIWKQDPTAPETIKVDYPILSLPDWLIRQRKQQRSSGSENLIETNVYHHSNDARRPGGADTGLLGDQNSETAVVGYRVPPSQSYSRQTSNFSGRLRIP